MDSLDPLISLLILLTVLSVAAERITNLLKLRRETLRVSTNDPAAEKAREYAIVGRGLVVCIGLAVLVKANLFEMIHHLDEPFRTLGWVRLDDTQWVRSAATLSWGTFSYALAGCVLTGISLGFGSKFWHDILDAVFEVRDLVKKQKLRVESQTPATNKPAASAPAASTPPTGAPTAATNPGG